jgi:3-dehydroquinate dehydratase/shikimate dehydrogenase
VVVAGVTSEAMACQLKRALKQTRMAEVRLDWLASDAERARFLHWLQRQRIRGTLLATCRMDEAGGKYRGELSEQLLVLMRAVSAGCAWCDVEIETAIRLPAGALRALLRPARILLSLHDFQKTPRDLVAKRAMLRRVRRSDTDAVKVATTAKTLAEGLRVIALAHGQRDVVAIPMGEICAPLRILALREGSALGYAPVEHGTAEGQFALDDLRNIFRAGQIGRDTRVYGVIGNPVEHSLSPVLHNVAFKNRRIDAVYLPFLVRDLRDFLDAVERIGIDGFSVTLPHKHSILRFLDDCEPLAAKIGAVNTVMVRAGKLYGCNTDYAGVLQALEGRMQLTGSRVLLFGAGGAARAAAFALAHAGAFVLVCSRRPAQAQALARAIGGEAILRKHVRRESFDAILNATPVGMFPNTKISPLLPGELHCRIVMDLIYRPMNTRLLQIAHDRGIATVSGVEMFLAQGIAQWEMWTGRRAPKAAMRDAVLELLREEERAQARARAAR